MSRDVGLKVLRDQKVLLAAYGIMEGERLVSLADVAGVRRRLIGSS